MKDSADLNPTNLVCPHINQLHIGWATKGEWRNHTVQVKALGIYTIKSLRSYQASTVSFDLNHNPAAICKLPVATPSWRYWNFAEIGSIYFPKRGGSFLPSTTNGVTTSPI